jgi:tetratricopeptide (TPR) repeat protein
MLSDSLAQYYKALEIEPSNEYCLSNIGVIYLKRQDYDKCLKFTSEALAVIENFQSDT